MMPNTRDRLPSFARPPLIEVVCGVLFRQIDAFLLPHFGLLWAERKTRIRLRAQLIIERHRLRRPAADRHNAKWPLFDPIQLSAYHN